MRTLEICDAKSGSCARGKTQTRKLKMIVYINTEALKYYPLRKKLLLEFYLHSLNIVQRWSLQLNQNRSKRYFDFPIISAPIAICVPRFSITVSSRSQYWRGAKVRKRGNYIAWISGSYYYYCYGWLRVGISRNKLVLISIGLQKSSRVRVCASIIMCWVFLNMPVFCALRQYFDILHKCWSTCNKSCA